MGNFISDKQWYSVVSSLLLLLLWIIVVETDYLLNVRKSVTNLLFFSSNITALKAVKVSSFQFSGIVILQLIISCFLLLTCSVSAWRKIYSPCLLLALDTYWMYRMDKTLHYNTTRQPVVGINWSVARFWKYTFLHFEIIYSLCWQFIKQLKKWFVIMVNSS